MTLTLCLRLASCVLSSLLQPPFVNRERERMNMKEEGKGREGIH